MTKTLCYRFMLLLLVISYFLTVSCKHRNPNLSKKQLLELANDTTAKAEEIPAYEFPDTSYVPPVGAKYTEIRSVDPASPPVTLKVSIPQGTKQPLKLSRFGSSVEYVILRLPDENNFFLSSTRITTNYPGGGSSGGYANTQVNRLGDYFVTSDRLGIYLFDPSGNFVQNLLQSEFSGQREAQKIVIDFEDYKRADMMDIVGTRCFLSMTDHEGNMRNLVNLMRGNPSDTKYWAGEFNLANRPIFTPQLEMPSLTPGVDMIPIRYNPSGMFLNDDIRFSFNKVGNPLAYTFSNMGDTLCKFTDFLTESGGAYNSDVSFFYRAGGELFFRREFCDTFYRVQSANQIVPIYCFDFGEKRLLPSEGATDKTQGKLVPNKWIVFKNEMMLIFSEGRDCPNCRTHNEVTFYCLLFDKKTGQATAIDMRSRYPENILIENDLDGGLPVPLSTLHIQDETIIATFAKEQIQEMLKNNSENYAPETVDKLKTFAETLKQHEMLVMVIK